LVRWRAHTDMQLECTTSTAAERVRRDGWGLLLRVDCERGVANGATEVHGAKKKIPPTHMSTQAAASAIM
jgi:hypothetical protein